MSERFDADAINHSTNLVELVSRYRELTRKGNEYEARCIGHTPDNHPSMRVVPDKGFVHCHACGYHENAIGFLMTAEGIEFKEACRRLTNGGTASLPPVIVQPQKQLAKAPPWRTFPANGSLPDMKIGKLGEPSATWEYHAADGGLLGFVARYDTPEGKEIRCWTWGNHSDAEPMTWQCKHFPAPRPLYGLDRLAQRPTAQVMICEGEKAADAATRLFPGMVATCWPGGASAVRMVDWSPLAGRDVVCCSDNDEPGRKAMLAVSKLLTAAKRVRGINTNSWGDGDGNMELPEAWDLGDCAAHVTPEMALNWAKGTDLEGNPRLFDYPVTQDRDADIAAQHEILPVEAYNDEPPPDHRARRKPNGRATGVPDASAGHSQPVSTLPDSGSVTAASLGVISRRLSDVQFKPVKWLWKDRIPCGKVSMIVGNPGLGKSQLCASLAALITTGGKWPVTRDNAPLGSVIVLSAEDDADDTIGPRMEAAGADCSRIHMLDAVKVVDETGAHVTRGFDIGADINRLIVLMHEIGDVKLVIIDPISAYLGMLDSHKNSDVRGAMAKLKDAASDAAAGVLIVNHLNKSQGQDALLKSQGSVGFVAAARAVWGVAKDKENPQRRLFMPLKNNLGTDETGLAYSIESHLLVDSDPAINTSRVMWESQAVNLSAEEVFAVNSDENRNATVDAQDYLKDVLAQGPMRVKDLALSSRKAGHNWPTVKIAKQRLKIISRKVGFGQTGDWEWVLPGQESKGYGQRED